MSSPEFVRWKVYFEQEWNRHDKLDFYLAAIATAVIRGNAKNPSSVQLDDQLLKFSQRVERPRQAMTEKDRQTRLDASKAFWLGVAQVRT